MSFADVIPEALIRVCFSSMTKKDKNIIIRDKGDSVLLEIEASTVEAPPLLRSH